MAFYVRMADELRRRGRVRAEHARHLAARLDRRALLRRAWAIARDGARRFGDRPVLYLAEALRLAWSEAKARIATARAMAEDRRDLEAGRSHALAVAGKLALLEQAGAP